MFDRVVAIISSVVGMEYQEITSDSNLLIDLGFSSLDVVDLALGLEEEFNIVIPDRDFNRFLVVKDIIGYLGERLASE